MTSEDHYYFSQNILKNSEKSVLKHNGLCNAQYKAKFQAIKQKYTCYVIFFLYNTMKTQVFRQNKIFFSKEKHHLPTLTVQVKILTQRPVESVKRN